ncbi:MAG: CbiX/SirB N-terminal domain-containing protein [Gammaproteobacteria bacterium]|jgi:sirohydrochlorin ferrochelatase
MKSLLIVAHGSRRSVSNEEVRKLAEQVTKQLDNVFDDVSAAFLELADPSIPDGLEACIKRGATEVVVFPYFLAAGRHVVEDIPAEIAPIVAKYSDVKIHLAPHLGQATALPEIIIDTAKQGHQ